MVTLISPNVTKELTVTEEEAKRILEHPLNANPTALWAIKDTKKHAIATVDTNGNHGAPEKPEGETANTKGNSPRK